MEAFSVHLSEGGSVFVHIGSSAVLVLHRRLSRTGLPRKYVFPELSVWKICDFRRKLSVASNQKETHSHFLHFPGSEMIKIRNSRKIFVNFQGRVRNSQASWIQNWLQNADFTEGNPPSGGGRTRKSAENAAGAFFVRTWRAATLPRNVLRALCGPTHPRVLALEVWRSRYFPN